MKKAQNQVKISSLGDRMQILIHIFKEHFYCTSAT